MSEEPDPLPDHLRELDNAVRQFAPLTRLMTEAQSETKRGASILPLSPKIGGGTYTSLGGQRYTLTNEGSRP